MHTFISLDTEVFARKKKGNGVWELLNCSLIGINNCWPGMVKLLCPSYKILSRLSLHFEFVPCPLPTLWHSEGSLLSHLFAFAYAVPTGKPLSSILWQIPAHLLR